jgi:hypothetical protein
LRDEVFASFALIGLIVSVAVACSPLFNNPNLFGVQNVMAYLHGYTEAEAAVESNPKNPGDTIEKLCKDTNLGYLYGFSAPQYSKEIYKDDSGRGFIIYYDSKYDFDSIMHYSSNQGFASDGDPSKVGQIEEYPLVRWLLYPKDPPYPKPTREYAFIVGGNVDITDDDA